MTNETTPSIQENVAFLFQADSLVPAEYFETFRRKTHLEPEKRLMFAVLDDAIACFQKYVSAREGRGKQNFRETEEWFLEENSEWPFAFENICDVLGLDPHYLRQGLLRWKEKHSAGPAKKKIYRLTLEKKRAQAVCA